MITKKNPTNAIMTIMTLFYSEAKEQNGKFFPVIEYAHNKRTIELRYIANLVHDNSTHTILPNHYTHPGYHEMPPHRCGSVQCFSPLDQHVVCFQENFRR